jgi:hypothetical protein
MRLLTALVMAKLSTGQLLKGAERIEMIRRLNDNHSDRELVKYIDGETFHYIYTPDSRKRDDEFSPHLAEPPEFY